VPVALYEKLPVTAMRVIVTGGNSGVGKATAGALAAAGHSVLIACRTISKYGGLVGCANSPPSWPAVTGVHICMGGILSCSSTRGPRHGDR
jgi:hypothetical protein